MADFYANQQTIRNAVPYGQPLTNRINSDARHGRVRYFESVFVAPASGAAPAIADKIRWGALPIGARILGGLSKLYWNAGTASCTINLGDNMSAARHLAATAITALGNAVPEAAALVTTGACNTVSGSTTIVVTSGLGGFQVGSLIVGTGIPAGTTITGVDLAAATCILSAAATATNSAQAMTLTGQAYRTTNDASKFETAFGSTLDDCNLVSVVAGAQVANSQVITLKIAYVMD
jgi:hypothetical protein